MNVSQYEALLKALETGLMSMMLIQGFSRRICAVPLDPPAWRDLGFGCRRKSGLSKAASAFLQCVRERLAENGYSSGDGTK